MSVAVDGQTKERIDPNRRHLHPLVSGVHRPLLLRHGCWLVMDPSQIALIFVIYDALVLEPDAQSTLSR